MKLQGLSIIFIMIIAPIILVLAYYVSLQIDTITLQTKYENALIDATNDAMNAFELNTANEDLSNVSDSLRTIVQASTNTFFNTFATSIGMSNASKTSIQPFIPAMLYTLYDGFYIYAPTETPVILEKTSDVSVDGLQTSNGYATVGDVGVTGTPGNYSYTPQPEGATTPKIDSTGDPNYGVLLYERNDNSGLYTEDITNAKFKPDYVLKSFMPYSATYISGLDKVTINYTLDNFMNISAKIDDVYYTKSGYYINTDLLNSASIDINNIGTTGYGQDELKQMCEGSENISITITIRVNGTDIDIDIDSNMEYYDSIDMTTFAGSGIIGQRTLDELENLLRIVKEHEVLSINPDGTSNVTYGAYVERIQELEEKIANRKAVMYYLTNTAFSNWVNDKLSGIVVGNNLTGVVKGDPTSVVEVGDYSLQDLDMYHNFDDDITTIFSNVEDPENEGSVFNNHKYNIIKNSIQYNLNLAISSYSYMYDGLQFEMPALTADEWETITEKLSIIAYAQGLKCGTKDFSGYAVISSTNNEMTVIPEEIYYVRSDEFNKEDDMGSRLYYHRLDCPSLAAIGAVDNLISFKSKEVKYDSVHKSDTADIMYSYDHKNYACYDCILDNNYNNYDLNGDGTLDKKIKLRAYLGLENDVDGTINDHPNENLQKAYFIAIGKERQSLYKTTQYSQNEGIRTEDFDSINWEPEISKAIVTIQVTDPQGIVENITVGGNSTGKSISTSTVSTQTVELENDGVNGAIGVDGASSIDVMEIKYIYK